MNYDCTKNERGLHTVKLGANHCMNCGVNFSKELPSQEAYEKERDAKIEEILNISLSCVFSGKVEEMQEAYDAGYSRSKKELEAARGLITTLKNSINGLLPFMDVLPSQKLIASIEVEYAQTALKMIKAFERGDK